MHSQTDAQETTAHASQLKRIVERIAGEINFRCFENLQKIITYNIADAKGVKMVQNPAWRPKLADVDKGTKKKYKIIQNVSTEDAPALQMGFHVLLTHIAFAQIVKILMGNKWRQEWEKAKNQSKKEKQEKELLKLKDIHQHLPIAQQI